MASDILVENVQNIICPNITDKGEGLSPIGHKTTITTPTVQEINIKTKVTLTDNVTLSIIQGMIQSELSQYLLELRKTWEDNDRLIIRISQIEARILNIDGVLDIAETTINEQTSNLEVLEECIPMLENMEVQEL